MATSITPTPERALEALHALMLPGDLGGADAKLPAWVHVTMLDLMETAKGTPSGYRMTALLHSVFLLGVAAERNGWTCEYEAYQS